MTFLFLIIINFNIKILFSPIYMFIQLINGILDKADTFLSFIIHISGPFFIIGVTIFDCIILKSFISITIPYITENIGQIASLVIGIIETYLFINLQLNFILSIIVKPGSLRDIANSKKQPHHNDDLDFNQILLNESNQSCINPILPICDKCDTIKLIRSHHCSICNQCVIKMDHHCPWINNCIGLNNHRYFLLFLFYAHLYLIYSLALGILVYIYNHPYSKKELYRVSTIINMICLFMTSFFIMWQWVFALKGITTVEYWMKRTGKNENENIKDYSFWDWRDNLMVVFGTKSILSILFAPSIKRLGLNGTEWTKLVFPDYEINKSKLK